MTDSAARARPKIEVEEADPSAIVRSHRLAYKVGVDQPLVLISQVQRSGGTLLTQLLDGHSELHVLPIEPHLAKPKWHWPSIDLEEEPGRLFRRFGQRSILKGAQRGFVKLGEPARQSPVNDRHNLPFIFIPKLQGALFQAFLKEVGALTPRKVVDAYFSAFFNAWIDYQGLYGSIGRVKKVVAFMPRLVGSEGQFAAFTGDYPDGKAIALVRDPASWYASASRHAGLYDDFDAAIALWSALNKQTLAIAKADPERVLIVAFESLVRETERVMRRVAAFVGIGYEPSLIRPTFNRIATVSNSSFEPTVGLDRSAAERDVLLDAPTRSTIRARTAELYDALKSIAVV